MAYYDALIAKWATLTPGTTAAKLAQINAMTVTGSVPNSVTFSGVSLLNSINYAEFKNLTAAQQSNILLLCAADKQSGGLLGGSANTAFLPVGMIIDYFTPSASITSGTYNNATGIVTLTMAATIKFGPGGSIIVSGLTGTGAFASLNGTFAPISPTSGTTVTYQAASGLGGTTITGGSITPPTVTALTQMAKGFTQPWWEASVADGGGGLTSPVTAPDLAAAGGLT
jgi:hypothetical protein